MNLSERDKKVVIIGGIAALVILVLGYGVIPLLRGWSGSNAALSAKAAAVKELRERIDSQDALVKQRNALAKRMGSLFEAPAKPEQKKDDSKTPKPDADKKAGASAQTPESPKPADGATVAAAQSPESAKPETKPADGTTVAAAQSPESPKPEAKPEDSIVVASAQSPETPKPEAKGDDKKGDAKKDEKPKPESTTGATLAGYVEQSARKAEATVKSITPTKTSAGLRNTHFYRPVMLQVKLQCKAKGLVDLLQALENGDRFVKVEQIQLHREANKDDINVTLDVRAYESVGKTS